MEQPRMAPDFIILPILRLLDTKSALRMSFLSKQWEGLWTSIPALDFDFDEGGKPDDYGNNINLDNLLRHKNFINILTRHLEYRAREHDDSLDKFRLRMVRYLHCDASIVNKWLKYSFARDVKDLDISLRISEANWNILDGALCCCYCLSVLTFMDAQFLTSLNLEFVRLTNQAFDRVYYDYGIGYVRFLPRLKTMCLKSVYLDKGSLAALIGECLFIESLSLTYCTFESEFRSWFSECTPIRIKSRSLKFLEIKHCDAGDIDIEEATSLESFTLVSSRFPLYSVNLWKSYSLKRIDIHAEHLGRINVSESHESLQATINTPSLVAIHLKGHLRHRQVVLKAPKLRTAAFTLEDVWDDGDEDPWKNFHRMGDFLKELSCSERLFLNIHGNFRALIFPEDVRKTISTPLPNVETVTLDVLYPPTEKKDIDDLRDSFEWMAPSANRRINPPRLISIDGKIWFEGLNYLV